MSGKEMQGIRTQKDADEFMRLLKLVSTAETDPLQDEKETAKNEFELSVIQQINTYKSEQSPFELLTDEEMYSVLSKMIAKFLSEK